MNIGQTKHQSDLFFLVWLSLVSPVRLVVVDAVAPVVLCLGRVEAQAGGAGQGPRVVRASAPAHRGPEARGEAGLETRPAGVTR